MCNSGSITILFINKTLLIIAHPGIRTKKPAPGIPGTVLLEPYLNLEPGCCPAEIRAGIIATVHGDGQPPAQIDAEHLHKALSVYRKSTAVYRNRVVAGGGHGHKVLHILYRFQFNFQCHVFPPRLYKQDSIVYNWEARINKPLFTRTYSWM